MNITEVKIYKLDGDKTVALANIVIDNDFVVTGLKIVNGVKGLFVAMPSKKNMKEDRTKDYYDIAFPITKEAREQIQSSVLDKYNSFNDQDSKDIYNNIQAGKQKEIDKRNESSIDVFDDTLPF